MSRNAIGIRRGARFQIVNSRPRKPRKRSSRYAAFECLERRELLAFASALGSISGTVWNDQNGNGVRDTSESRQSGWVVYADTNNNSRLDRGEPATVSGRDGSYRLSVAPGTFTIRESAVPNWQVTAPVGGSHSVTVTARSAVTGKDFGNQYAAGTVAGTVWNDQDGDGVRDAGESVQSGWQVYVDANNNGRYDSGESATLSGRDGTYRLTLTPGTYTIRETTQSGWQVTLPSGGSYSITLTTGDALTRKDFGNQTTQTITGGAFDIDLTLVGLTASQQVIAQQAAARWETVIVGDLPDVRTRGRTIDDVAITISLQPIDGAGNIIGEGGPEGLRSGTSLPYLGSVIIDRADAGQLEREGTLLDTMTHEIGHVLGLGTIWETKRLLSGARTSNPVFTGAQATAAYNTLFGTHASGVPVEAEGGNGTALGHWRESVFQNELMVGTIHSGGMALSIVTVASMADLGYQVDVTAAEPYTRPDTTAAAVRSSTWISGSMVPWVSTSAPSFGFAAEGMSSAAATDLDCGHAQTGTASAWPGASSSTRIRAARQEALAAVDHVFQYADGWLES